MALTFSVPDTELTLTLHNRRPVLVDNIFQGTPFMAALRQYDAIEMQGGGLELVRPLRMAKNTTAGSFDSYDILDTTPQSTETSARFPWAFEYATISIAWTEEQKNEGPGKLLDLVRVKSDDAADTLKDKVNIHLLQAPPSAGSKDPISIQELIQADPTTNPARTASIGNISDANVFWRNKQLTGGAFSVADMNNMYNTVSDGNDPPTFLLSGQTIFEYYENSQVGMIRYQDSRLGDLGFQNLLYKSKPYIWDPQIGLTNALYFIEDSLPN